MHQNNVKARTNTRLSVNDLHIQSKYLVLAGVYLENMSCARNIMSRAQNNQCSRDNMSWDEITSRGHEILCRAHDIILKKLRVLNIPPYSYIYYSNISMSAGNVNFN